MGLISRIRGRKTALTNQADKRSEVANRYEVQIQAHIDDGEALRMYKTACKISGDEANILTLPITRQSYVKVQIRPIMNATRKERQNHGE